MGSYVQRRGAVAVARADERLVRLQLTKGFVIIALPDGAVDLLLHRRNGYVGTTHPLAAVLFFFLHGGDDVPIAAVPRERERRGRIAVRVNALARVCAGRHQQTHHGRVAAQYRVMQRPMLIVAGHIHIDQFRTGAQQRPSLVEISRLYRLRQPRDICAIHKRLEPGPTFVAICTRQNPLRIVQGKCGEAGMALVAGDLRRGGRNAGAIFVQQVFSLFSQLFDAGLRRQTPQPVRVICGH